MLIPSCLSVLAVLSLVPRPVSLVEKSGSCPTNAHVEIVRDGAIPAEGYRLSVRPDGIAIASSDEAGRFYAGVTLGQLRTGATYPCVEIEDRPAYRWRGLLIDEARRFFGKGAVLRILDQMAEHKLNVLHWHLTDDQGWRIDVPGLPELVRYGSVRPESPKRFSEFREFGDYRYEAELDGEPYGPFFYSERDLREIVARAKDLHITVVPEIDFPGHFRSALAAYPHLACFPERIVPRQARALWGISTDVLCVGNDESVALIERILDYVCDVFPSEVIHIGGDECPRLNWEKCPKCRARMKAEGLADAGRLQDWIARKAIAHLAKRGRRAMGWDELLGSGDVPRTVIGQSWRTQSGEGVEIELVNGATGARRGYDMVVNPHTKCYYNYRQGLDDDPYPYAGLVVTLRDAYAFDPADGVPVPVRSHVLGSEACLWGEFIATEDELAWKMWPRTSAMAEVLWTNPPERDFADFVRRLATHRRRLIAKGVNCAPLARDAGRSDGSAPDIQEMIDRAAAAGGGTVTVPPGEWETKPLVLRSGVTLKLEKGATIVASTNIADYAIQEGERTFVSATDAENVGICGEGTFDGRGYAFKESREIPGESQPQCLPVMFRFTRCRNLSLSGFAYRRCGAWGCHLRNCDGVVIRRVTCFNHVNNTNDGIDIESRNVLIEDCDIDADDDAIVLKTESDKTFEVTNVVIRNCRLASCCNAFKFGTGSYCDFRNVRLENCVFARPKGNFRCGNRARFTGKKGVFSGSGGIALEVCDGGRMEDVTIRNVTIEGYLTPVFIRLERRRNPPPGRETYLRNVLIERVTGVADSRIASSVTGVPGLRPSDIVLRDCVFAFPGGGTAEDAARPVPEKEGEYPDCHMFDGESLPAWAFYVRHADRVRFENVTCGLLSPDARQKFVFDDSDVTVEECK